MSVLAFIPARGGSKGIPRKNLYRLLGKPLIHYTIEVAKKSKEISDIIFSSEDEEIIHTAENSDIEILYRRPIELAQDDSPTWETVAHGLSWQEKASGESPEMVILLQPTCPLRTADDIDRAVRQFRERSASSLMSVHEMAELPYECVRLTEKNWEFLEKPIAKVRRRQDYQGQCYYVNGAIYIVTPQFLKEQKSFYKEGETELFFMEQDHGVDIDNIYEAKFAELLIRERIKSQNNIKK